MPFEKILIANRGEIACRIMRTARALGYRTVAVYSDADAGAPHVQAADEAVHVGASTPADSYLNIERLLEAARRTGAGAVHPGYGFLSERAGFARACADAGLVFIGPPPEAIEAMGDKAAAKRRMLAAGVPCAPGYLGEDQSDERLEAEARRLGVPLLVKAVAGGAGRGMRRVRDLAELAQALGDARREAHGAFGDGTLMIERMIEGGRHIEIQVFADAHGHVVHLGERDCTVQRRHQKVIEEAPSPVVDAAMRARMGADAVAAAQAVGYRGAGTVEFIVDADLNHYFLEMNTRLQVEHPVTECITGIDLVEWQLRVAAGEPLPLAQHEIRFGGHAIEARLYAEDPYAGFAPQTGKVLHWRPHDALRGRTAGAPHAGRGHGQAGPGHGAPSGVRIDAGIAEGGDVTPFYDPMLAKLIAHGRDRDDAIRRLIAALDDAPLVGVPNNARLLRDLLGHAAFRHAHLHTALLDQWSQQGEPPLRRPVPDEADWCIAAAVLALRGDGAVVRPAGVAAWDLTLGDGDERRTLRVHPHDRRVAVGMHARTVTVEVIAHDGHRLRYAIDGVQRERVCVRDGDVLYLAREAAVLALREASPWPAGEDHGDPRFARAPVAGTIAAIGVAPGDAVAAGQPLVCVEAMKMELWLNAGRSGRVVAVHARLRDTVEAGAVLVELQIEETR
jgi:geranyl-CoA carboxylase alpha subunit